MDIEEKQMNALPAHRHLKNPVQLAQRRRSRDQNTPQCHRADTRKADLQLTDLRGSRHFNPLPPGNPNFNCPTLCSALLKQVVEQGPERGRNFDEAMHGLRVALQPYAIPGWHCSRLTEAEVYGIRSKGMKPPNAEMLARRIDALMEAGEITPEMGRRLKLENQAGDKNRAGRTWFCFFPPSNAGEDGIARFFRHWGGEALYFCHENDPVLSSAISCIGTPCLVEADVPIASLRMHGALEQAIYRRYLVSQDNSKVWPTDYEDCIEYPLPAGNVRRVITFPDPEFMSLTGCSEWRRPIPEG